MTVVRLKIKYKRFIGQIKWAIKRLKDHALSVMLLANVLCVLHLLYKFICRFELKYLNYKPTILNNKGWGGIAII